MDQANVRSGWEADIRADTFTPWKSASRWIRFIKALREEHGVSIHEAHVIAAARPEWRRWVERQINSDSECRRMALRHIKNAGRAALLARDGETLRVR